MFNKGRIVIAITIIPIPPSHCNKDLQTNVPFDAFSTSGKIVDPVVVIPETLSKRRILRNYSRLQRF